MKLPFSTSSQIQGESRYQSLEMTELEWQPIDTTDDGEGKTDKPVRLQKDRNTRKKKSSLMRKCWKKVAACCTLVSEGIVKKIHYCLQEIQLECYENMRCLDFLQYVAENCCSWLFFPYLPAFHSPGWLLRYLVGPYTTELCLSLIFDIVAGVTVALTLIPQALSYAQLADLPPITGLYTAVLTAGTYVILGSSNQLCVGPVALVSLLTAQLINQYNIDYMKNPEEALDFAGEVAVAVGAVLSLMAIINAGVLVRFIAHPVMSGFTTGAAALIGLNQLKSAFGFSVAVPQQGQVGYEYNYHVMQWFIDNWNGPAYRNPYATAICFGLFIPLILIHFLKILVPVSNQIKKTLLFHLWTIFTALLPFLAIVIGAHIAWAIKKSVNVNHPDFSNHDLFKDQLSVVGKVTPGLNFIRIPHFRWPFLPLLVDVVQIALVAYMESYGIAQKIAREKNEFQLLSASQELWAIGISNFVAAISSAYPVAGSFSRTSLNAFAGARTPLSKFVNMIVVILALKYLTATFEFIPNAALAAVIWVAVFNLITFTDFWLAWKHSKKDFLVMLTTLVFVFVFNTGVGLVVGIIASVFLILVELTIHPETSPEIVPDAHDDIRYIRIIRDLNFLSIGRLNDLLTSLTMLPLPSAAHIDQMSTGDRIFHKVSSFLDSMLKRDRRTGAVKKYSNVPKAIILDFEHVRLMDLSALEELLDQIKNIREKRIAVTIIHANPAVTKTLVAYGFKNDFFDNIEEPFLAEKYNQFAGIQLPKASNMNLAELSLLHDEDASD